MLLCELNRHIIFENCMRHYCMHTDRELGEAPGAFAMRSSKIRFSETKAY